MPLFVNFVKMPFLSNPSLSVVTIAQHPPPQHPCNTLSSLPPSPSPFLFSSTQLLKRWSSVLRQKALTPTAHTADPTLAAAHTGQIRRNDLRALCRHTRSQEAIAKRRSHGDFGRVGHSPQIAVGGARCRYGEEFARWGRSWSSLSTALPEKLGQQRSASCIRDSYNSRATVPEWRHVDTLIILVKYRCSQSAQPQPRSLPLSSRQELRLTVYVLHERTTQYR